MYRSVEVRQALTYDGDSVSEETAIGEFEDTLTSQADADDCDINVLVRRFGVTGEVPNGNVRPPIVADFVGNMNYQDALNALIEADNSFMAMPADVRSRFNHDPGEFVNFCSDPKNIDEMRKLGLAVPPKPELKASDFPDSPKAAADPAAPPVNPSL